MALSHESVVVMRFESFTRELPYALEKSVPHGKRCVAFDHDERALDETREQVEHLEVVAAVRNDSSRALERPSTHEHREAAHESLLRLEQVIPAPLDRREHGLLTGRPRGAGAREHL